MFRCSLQLKTMARTILWMFSFIMLCSATLAAEFTIESGEALHVSTDAYTNERIAQLAVDYRVLGSSFNHRTQESWPLQPFIDEYLVLNLPPGTYPFYRRVEVNDRVVAQLRDTIVVLPPGSLPEDEAAEPSDAESEANTTETVKEGIIVPPIPDVEAGTSIMLPITVSGKGTYSIQLPTLAIGTYQAPSTVTVDGTETINILLHIDEDAQPGTHSVPVRIGDEQINLRVRVIRYVPERAQVPAWLILVVLAVVILAVLLILFTRRGREPPRAPRERNQTDEDLITYY